MILAPLLDTLLDIPFWFIDELNIFTNYYYYYIINYIFVPFIMYFELIFSVWKIAILMILYIENNEVLPVNQT